MHACYVHFRPMLNAYPTIQQWRLLNSVNRATPTLTKDLGFYGLVRRTPNIETCWGAFAIDTVTACFKNLGLMWLRFEP